MSVTAKQVQDLRKMSGAGMMDCKAALAENNADIDLAFQWLREKGIVAYPVHDAWLVKQSDVEEALYTIRLVIRDYIIKHCKHKRVVDITVPISVEVLGQDNKIEKVRHSGGYNS